MGEIIHGGLYARGSAHTSVVSEKSERNGYEGFDAFKTHAAAAATAEGYVCLSAGCRTEGGDSSVSAYAPHKPRGTR
jgi:hypothetical protein